jgi:hypothetical protein
MATHSCPWKEERELRAPSSGDEVVERWGAGSWEVERAAELRGYELEKEILKEADAWYKSIECEGNCKVVGEQCQKGHLWVGPPAVVKTTPKVVEDGRFRSKWRIKLHAVGKLKIMCECGKPRHHGGKIAVD